MPGSGGGHGEVKRPWICVHCGTENDGYADRCKQCNVSRNGEQPEAKEDSDA